MPGFGTSKCPLTFLRQMQEGRFLQIPISQVNDSMFDEIRL